MSTGSFGSSLRFALWSVPEFERPARAASRLARHPGLTATPKLWHEMIPETRSQLRVFHDSGFVLEPLDSGDFVLSLADRYRPSVDRSRRRAKAKSSYPSRSGP